MGNRSCRKSSYSCVPVYVIPANCPPVQGVSIATEPPLESRPPEYCVVEKVNKPEDSKFYAESYVVRLPLSEQPSFIYFGRTKSSTSADGYSSYSRDHNGRSITGSDTGAEDNVLGVERKIVLVNGQKLYEYKVQLKRPGIGAFYSGACDPEKLAIRLGGRDYLMTGTGTMSPVPVPLPLPLDPPASKSAADAGFLGGLKGATGPLPKSNTPSVNPPPVVPKKLGSDDLPPIPAEPKIEVPIAPPPKTSALPVVVENKQIAQLTEKLLAMDPGKPVTRYQVNTKPDENHLHYLQVTADDRDTLTIITRSENPIGQNKKCDVIILRRVQGDRWALTAYFSDESLRMDTPIPREMLEKTAKNVEGGLSLATRVSWLLHEPGTYQLRTSLPPRPPAPPPK